MMACRIDHLVFWAGGVAVTPVWRAGWDAICPGRRPGTEERVQLHRLEQGLAAGTLSPEDFCARAADLAGGAVPVRDLMEKLPAQIAPIPGMADIFEDLACRRLALSLISDYPRRWLIPALERSGLTRWFGQDQVWVAAEEGGFPALLDPLLQSGRLAAGRSLWVDHHSLRMSEVLRRGLDAAVFVHPRQFYRDLGLWGLVSARTSPTQPSPA
jgi:hypothetical protein